MPQTSPCLTESSMDVEVGGAWDRQHSQPCPRTFRSHHPREALGLSKLGTDTQRGKGRGYREGKGWGSW